MPDGNAVRPAEKRERCMNRTTACCLKCGWNPDEQVRRRALPLVKGADGLLHKDISTKE